MTQAGIISTHVMALQTGNSGVAGIILVNQLLLTLDAKFIVKVSCHMAIADYINKFARVFNPWHIRETRVHFTVVVHDVKMCFIKLYKLSF